MTTTQTTPTEASTTSIAAPATTATATATASTNAPPLHHLQSNKLYLYQNPQTKTPSQTPLSTLQIIRLLSSLSSTNNNTNNNSSVISPTTHIIGYDPQTQKYDPEGWKMICDQAVFKPVCFKWYYESTTTAGEENGSAAATNEIKGPISIKELVQTIVGTERQQQATRVWSDGRPEWKRWDDIPDLAVIINILKDDVQLKQRQLLMNDADNNNNNDDGDVMTDDAKAALKAFLSSKNNTTTNADDSDEEYESDGGTAYTKSNGRWIPSHLIKKTTTTTTPTPHPPPPKNPTKKRKKPTTTPSFRAKNAKHWIYVTNLPSTTTESDLISYFSRAGIIELDPLSQRPKVKLYRDGNTGVVKGDASVCYARVESVDLALQVLDGTLFFGGGGGGETTTKKEEQRIISVQRAKFEMKGDVVVNSKKEKKRVVSAAQRKVARLAALQAVGWDDYGENGRITGGLKGLRIIVLKHVFSLEDFSLAEKEDLVLKRIEREVVTTCSKHGDVEKITIFSKNRDGVVIVKFRQPTAASEAIEEYNNNKQPQPQNEGTKSRRRRIEATFWDGVTDYTVKNDVKEEKEEEERLDKFGDWLDNQELPEEFRPIVET